MKNQEEKITVKCPKCGEEIDIQDILKTIEIRNRLQEEIYKIRTDIKIIKKCGQNLENGICKIQSKIENLSKSDSEENKNMILELQEQKCEIEQIKQKITELIKQLEIKIKSFEEEISNNNFTCPDFGAETDKIKVLLKEAITLINSQEMFLNEKYRLKYQLNAEEAKISRLLQEQELFEKERDEIQTRIETFSKSDFQKEKNMVPELKKRLIDTEQRKKVNTAKIRETEEKIKSLNENIKSLEEEMHKYGKEKTK